MNCSARYHRNCMRDAWFICNIEGFICCQNAPDDSRKRGPTSPLSPGSSKDHIRAHLHDRPTEEPETHLSDSLLDVSPSEQQVDVTPGGYMQRPSLSSPEAGKAQQRTQLRTRRCTLSPPPRRPLQWARTWLLVPPRSSALQCASHRQRVWTGHRCCR